MATDAEKQNARNRVWMRLRVRQLLEQAALTARAADGMVYSEFVEQAGEAYKAMFHDLEVGTVAELAERGKLHDADPPVGTGGGR